MSEPLREMIEEVIRRAIPDATVRAESPDGTHWSATVVSPSFRGLSLVRQHQMVYGALGDRMKQEIHALSMKTLTPEQWKESNPI